MSTREIPSAPHNMIQQSFVFLDKVKEKTEKNLWKQGIVNWDSFLEAEKVKNWGELEKKERFQAFKSKKYGF